MKTLIAYASKYGCTELCARKIAAQLPDEVDLLDLGKVQLVDPGPYSHVILGGSIYAGMGPKKMLNFARRMAPLLKDKKIGLFLCCFDQGQNAQNYLERTFPPELIVQAATVVYPGWEIHWNRMNAFERWIVRNLAQIDADASSVDEVKIGEFCRVIREI